MVAISVETVTVVQKAKLDKNPYIRASQRMCISMKRGEDVGQKAMTRLNRCTRPAKIAGIYWAAKDFGLHAVARVAKAKYKELTGYSPS